MTIGERSLYDIQAALEQWTDNRVIHADDLEDLVFFWTCVPNVLSQIGYRLRGYQLRQRDDMWMLIVKATTGATPEVVFLSSSTPTGCIRLFVDHLSEDRLKWVHDRFPWN